MTFREFMRENGYELQTTFWEDFSIADRFGLSAVSSQKMAIDCNLYLRCEQKF